MAADQTIYVTQTIGGCESEPFAVAITKTVIDSEIYGTIGTLEVSEKNAGYYAWFKDGSYIINSNSASIPYNGETGAYSVVITKNGCTEVSRVYNMPSDLVTGVEGDTDTDWSVYPNPALGTFVITVAAKGIVNIYDVRGRIVYTTTVDNSTGMSETNPIRIPGGVYLVTFDDGTKMRTKRVVVY
jgi:hypothetical protein